jgi:hypothetical protein
LPKLPGHREFLDVKIVHHALSLEPG